MLCRCDSKNAHPKSLSISQDIPNQSEGGFNCTQDHFLLLKIAILANGAYITPQKMQIFHFCFHHWQDEKKPYLEQPLTQITMVHWNLYILLYSATKFNHKGDLVVY